ncbi:acid phosphatase [Ranunculus cassubicifolius]
MALCFIFFMVMSLVSASNGELQRLEHPLKEDGTLNFLVVGDWGRRGFYNQSRVAFQMGRIAKKLDIDFVISTGDNFYDNGLKDVNDLAFEESFTKIYTAKSLQKQWYSVLGNHDYRGNVEAQLSKVLKKIDHRWLCLRSFILDAEIVEFFFVDTTPFVDKYFKDPEDNAYDWNGVHPRRHYTKNILKDLESELRESTSKWKIVIGHHAIRSIGHHRDTSELVDQLLPILEAYNVDFYMNGHDHCLEHISSTTSPIEFLTSGAGSKAWRGDVDETHKDGVNFFYDGQGFMSMQLTENDAKIEYYDVFGKVLYSRSKFKELYSAM